MKTITKKDLVSPIHKPNSHKGDNGRVLIVGGSEDYVGCLALSGLAALRSGVDLVTIIAPEKVAWQINKLSPDLITKKCKGKYLSLNHYKQIITITKNYDVILIGTGIGIKKETVKLIKRLVKNIKKPLVIDADAIKAISLKEISNAVITPHNSEYKTLLKNSKIKENEIKKYIKNNVMIKKGKTDIIITKTNTYQNKTGHQSLSKAGTGDVLAGLVAGFIAQGLTLLRAAINASFIIGILGEHLYKKKAYSYIASDLMLDYKKILKKERVW